MYTTNHFDEIYKIDEIDEITLLYTTKTKTFSLLLMDPRDK